MNSALQTRSWQHVSGRDSTRELKNADKTEKKFRLVMRKAKSQEEGNAIIRARIEGSVEYRYSTEMIEHCYVGQDKADFEARQADALAMQKFAWALDGSAARALLNCGLQVSTTDAEDAVKAFQRLCRGQGFDTRAALLFCKLWEEAKRNNDGHPPAGMEFLDSKVASLSRGMNDLKFLYSAPGSLPLPAFDIAGQTEGAICNPQSRSMIGKTGASKAIQDRLGKPFKDQQLAFRAKHGNLVGNVKVADAFVAPVSGTESGKPMAVISVAGPNLKHHTGLRVKVRRLKNLLDPKGISKRQERKLRAAYETFFEGIERYNAHHPDNQLTSATLVPISANRFGCPPDTAARILVESAMRFKLRNGDVQLKILARNDDDLKKAITNHLGGRHATVPSYSGEVLRDLIWHTPAKDLPRLKAMRELLEEGAATESLDFILWSRELLSDTTEVRQDAADKLLRDLDDFNFDGEAQRKAFVNILHKVHSGKPLVRSDLQAVHSACTTMGKLLANRLSQDDAKETMKDAHTWFARDALQAVGKPWQLDDDTVSDDPPQETVAAIRSAAPAPDEAERVEAASEASQRRFEAESSER